MNHGWQFVVNQVARAFALVLSLATMFRRLLSWLWTKLSALSLMRPPWTRSSVHRQTRDQSSQVDGLVVSSRYWSTFKLQITALAILSLSISFRLRHNSSLKPVSRRTHQDTSSKVGSGGESDERTRGREDETDRHCVAGQYWFPYLEPVGGPSWATRPRDLRCGGTASRRRHRKTGKRTGPKRASVGHKKNGVDSPACQPQSTPCG